MDSTYTYPTFEICIAVWWLPILLLGLFPYRPEIASLTFTFTYQLVAALNHGMS